MDRLSSHCRHCRFYTPEGRRGGHCGQLGVSVSGSWKSCDLSLSAFAPSWESSEVFPAKRQIGLGTTRFSEPKVSANNTDSVPSDLMSGGWAAMDSKLPELVKTDR
jgi:hypothetical protein